MSWGPYGAEERFRAAWESVRVARPVEYGLFTFGESELPYFVVEDAARPGETVEITRGEVKVTRPMIITPQSDHPAFEGFFDDPETEGVASFLLSRTAAFSQLKLENIPGAPELVSDSQEEAVSRLNRRLDSEDEDRVAILTAPHGLARLAVLRYAAERIMQSAPGNIQELRERGFFPEL
ncbi:MAG: hypothetical protein DWQ34_17565 [Planctomycetota bacterium]|nr:MAG: hypothetical protein DWQ29_11025 [Planctomycetota bacterium]REJ90385.1 MAG: hypothetical protein DWQ34_17565 [Planctomycetota bacterium]REK28870.1 MAG: hypothetical protein DWQ41_04785 [Planctomycetota bacterium]REK39696.1 MAG: hypothetical protein DWQ45_02160 [Planctomycetota bacterium]